MWKNEIDNARECLRSGNAEAALSAYERAAQKQSDDMQYEDIRLAICICKYYLACQSSRMSEIDRAGEVLREVIVLCRKAGLACDGYDKDWLQDVVKERGVDPKGMKLKELVLFGSDQSKIGAIDAESLLLLGGLVYKGSKAPISFMQMVHPKDTKRLRWCIAEYMRDYMLICINVYLDEMGLDRNLENELYKQIVDLQSCTDMPIYRNYTLYGKDEVTLSVKEKMDHIYSTLGCADPKLKQLLIIMGAVFFVILLLAVIF